MDADTFNRYRSEIFGLYGAGRIEEALSYVERAARSATGDAAAELALWHVYLTSKLGRRDQALDTMRAATERRYLYAEQRFRGVPDLAHLQGDPEFESLVAQFATFRLQASQDALSVPPLFSSARNGAPLLIALHGNGSNARESAGRWRRAAEVGWSVVLPTSRQIGLTRHSHIWDDRQAGAIQLRSLWPDLAKALAPPVTVIGGFSMGAQIATWAALAGDIPAQGFIAVAPFFQGLDPTTLIDDARGREVRGAVICGERDAENVADVTRLYQELSAAGLRCEMTVVPGHGHDYPPGFDMQLEGALRFMAREG